MTIKRGGTMPRPRGAGSVYLQKGSSIWWVKYYRNGKAIRESTHTTKERKAEDFLRKRLGEIATGNFCGPRAERIRIEELAQDVLRDYRINRRKSVSDAETRWRLHLKPFFGDFRAVEVSSDLLARYVDARQQRGAQNASINRELALLKRAFYLGQGSTPPKVYRVPVFPRLAEDNIRKGFLDDRQYENLILACSELWFRALLELGRTYGWRVSELLGLQVKQIDLISRTIRLEPGTTKNRDGREVTMTTAVFELLKLCVAAKGPDDFVFTRGNAKPVRDFRGIWHRVCCATALGKMMCPTCNVPADAKNRCPQCSRIWRLKDLKYSGLIFHDLRRTAARNLRRAGAAEGVIMKIGGWRTRSVFERYAIVSQTDICDAIRKLEFPQNGHSFGHSREQEAPPSDTDQVQ